MREVELKAVVPDLDASRAALVAAGAVRTYAGRLEDRRYDTPARGLAGQSRAGAGGGAELKLRIGSELGTNLVIGGAIISDFGALAQLKLEWNVIRSWPMSVTVVATNQPVQTDLGVRLIYQVGWRFKHWFAPIARIGYDVRNINHGGLSLGLGVVMGW